MIKYSVDQHGKLTDERTEPLAADARTPKETKKALLKLIAGILKVDFADLWEREKREVRKRTLIASLVIIIFLALGIYASTQFLGDQKNKELERIKDRIALIDYSIRNDDLPRDKVIALNLELKKLKQDKENKEASLKALGELKTSIGKEAQKIYMQEGAKAAIALLASKETLADQESRLKEISREKVVVAWLYMETSELEKAKENFQRAIDLFFDYENAMGYVGLLRSLGSNLEAIKIGEKIIKLKLSNEERAQVLGSLGLCYQNVNRLEEAEKVQTESLKLYRELYKSNPNAYASNLANILDRTASLYMHTNRVEEADKILDESKKINRMLVKSFPQEYNVDLSGTLIMMAEYYLRTNRVEKAEESYQKVVELSQSLVQIDPETYSMMLATSLSGLAMIYKATNRLDEMGKAYLKAVEPLREVVKFYPSFGNLNLANAPMSLADLYKNERPQKAMWAYSEALVPLRILTQSNPESFKSYLVSVLNSLATLYDKTNKPDKAEAVRRELEALRAKKVKKSKFTSYTSCIKRKGYKMRDQRTATQNSFNPAEVKRYIGMMKQYGITTIVEMNKFLTSNMLWDNFSSLKRLNTYRNGQRETTSIGVSKEAYRAIASMYQTQDVVNARLVQQKLI